MNTTKYLQTDSRWSGLGYPKKPCTIGKCGCGEVSIVNSIIEMEKYKNYTPATIQGYCKQFADPSCNGTYWSGIPKMMKNYGLTEVKEHDTMPQLFKELAKGDRVAIYLMGSRLGGTKRIRWTSSGHFVCSVGYKYSNGKNYVYVKDSYSNSKDRNGWISYEENMKGDVLKVWSGKLNGKLTDGTTASEVKGTNNLNIDNSKLTVDGIGGKATVLAMQKFFGTTRDGIITGQLTSTKALYPALKSVQFGKGGSACIKKMQVWLGLSDPDGYLGKNTTKAWQKKLVALGYLAKNETIDGIVGVKTMKAWQECLNNNCKAKTTTTTTKPTTTTSNASKLVNKAKEVCWAYGTPEKKWDYDTGNPTTAFNNICGAVKRVTKSDCGYFIKMITKASGLGAWNPLGDSVPSNFKVVHSGKKIPDNFLKAGDIIWYKKKSGQHTLMYYGDNKIAEAGREIRFPVIRSDTKKYNKSDVKHTTIKVARAK